MLDVQESGQRKWTFIKSLLYVLGTFLPFDPDHNIERKELQPIFYKGIDLFFPFIFIRIYSLYRGIHCDNS
jgi:hypothetical protein